ncbi:M48 family metallopeptidase [Pseudoponticoccus marisrubri]|uniref:Peptidase M48 n=1 Tax=Pseudoponticoccus marisrubri TaxID=1685382 RepID=A0A0W7WHQ0_9RHOB|nr:M48 family metallopeptidase [Pseudoponticoccus marisrubri]KUF10082.1 peptidase M48 [Pseudoponticoccus marisrubri]
MQEAGAHFYDGLTAGRHEVRVALSGDRQALQITGETLPEPLRWPLQDLRALTDTSDSGRLTLTRLAETEDESPRDPARLVVLDPALIAWLRRTRPALFRTDLRKGTFRTVAKYAGGAVGAAALMLFVILPALANTMAAIIPVEREVAFGKTVTAQMERFLGGSRLGSLRCDNPAGEAALDAMLRRLTAGREMTYEVELQVFDHPMINAFAAPGGQVVIIRGLLDAAEGPDQVAGVLAHEIAHVESRDATRHALRAAGSAGILTMLIGDFTGAAAVAVMGEQVLSSAYSRKAEAAADVFALEMLAEARVSAEGFAAFFDHIDDLERVEIPEYLASHPVTAERAAAARDFAAGQEATRPVLNAAEWQALQRICD